MSKKKDLKQDAEFQKSIHDLTETAASTLALVQSFIKSSKNAESLAQPVPKDSPDPFDILNTAAKLLKAHTTKLSLLLINKPFTPSAVRRVISDIADSCIPAMMSAMEICSSGIYGKFLLKEVKFKVVKTFKEIEFMMEELLESLSSMNSKTVKTENSGRDKLSSTGVVWRACDELIELKGLNLATLLSRNVETYQYLVEDATNELLDWAEDEPEEPERIDEESVEPNDITNHDASDSFLDDFGVEEKLPKDREDLKVTLDMAVRKLKQIKSLYSALVKFRLSTVEIKLEPAGFPSQPISGDASPLLQRLDQVTESLEHIPELVDEMAGAFYDLDDEAARKSIDTICGLGKDIVESMKLGWNGQEDKFTTTWAVLWLRLIDQT